MAPLTSQLRRLLQGGGVVSEPEVAPTKAGYQFNYWELDGQQYDFSTPVTQDITLVANWTVPKEEYETSTLITNIVYSTASIARIDNMKPGTYNLTGSITYYASGLQSGTYSLSSSNAISNPSGRLEWVNASTKTTELNLENIVVEDSTMYFVIQQDTAFTNNITVSALNLVVTEV